MDVALLVADDPVAVALFAKDAANETEVDDQVQQVEIKLVVALVVGLPPSDKTVSTSVSRSSNVFPARPRFLESGTKKKRSQKKAVRVSRMIELAVEQFSMVRPVDLKYLPISSINATSFSPTWMLTHWAFKRSIPLISLSN